ncbi:hypothetical protein COOONC_10363 [Cooperia oncophora]
MCRRHSVVGSATPCESFQATSSVSFLSNDDALSNLTKFLTYYGEKVSEMKSRLRSRQREWDQYTEQIETLERQIDQLRCGYEYDSLKRNITIVVEMDAPATVELYVSYQVCKLKSALKTHFHDKSMETSEVTGLKNRKSCDT